MHSVAPRIGKEMRCGQTLMSFIAIFGPWVGLLALCLKFFGPIDFSPEQLADLTPDGGRFWVHLERDIPIYVGSMAACVLLILVTPWRNSSAEFNKPSDVFRSIAGIALALLPACVWSDLEAAKAHVYFTRAIPLLFAMCAAAVSLPTAWRLFVKSSSEPCPTVDVSENAFTFRPKLGYPDAAVLVFLTFLILIPVPGRLAGSFFQIEELNHWNGSVMSAASAFKHGAALYKDFVPVYGVAWPVLFGLAAGSAPLNYSTAILASMWLGVGYLGLLYYLLRQFSLCRFFAFAITCLAAMITTFPGLEPETKSIIWRWGGGFVMRSSPCDLLFFISLLRYVVKPDRTNAVLMGLTVGLSLLFATDVGIFLGSAFLLGWAFLCMAPGGRQRISHAGLSVAVLVLTILSGLAIATRGTLFQTETILNMVNYINRTSSGFGLIPFSELQSQWVAVFVFEIVCILAVVSLSFHRNPRCWRADDAVPLAVGLYVLQRMVYFMGRTHWVNLVTLFIPFLLALTLLLRAVFRSGLAGVDSKSNSSFFVRSYEGLFGTFCLISSLIIFVISKDVPNYPAVWNPRALRMLSQDTLALRPELGDIQGLPVRYGEYAGYFQAVAKRISNLHQLKLRIHVLDACSTTMYVVANIPPYGSDSNEFDRADISVAETRGLIRRVTENGADVIVLNRVSFPWPRVMSGAAWAACRESIFQAYRKKEEYGPFEVWYRNGIDKPSG